MKFTVAMLVIMMSAMGAVAQQNGMKGTKRETAASAGEAKAASAETPKPIPVDEGFLEVWENADWIGREITRIEGLSGQVEIRVSIRELRKQWAAKNEKMRAWTAEHKVPEGWVLWDDGEKKFFGPPPQAPPAGAAEAKPSEKK